MRLGKPMEHLQAAVKAMAVADPVLKITAIARQLGYALYLANDHLVWVITLAQLSSTRRLKHHRSSTRPRSRYLPRTVLPGSTTTQPVSGQWELSSLLASLSSALFLTCAPCSRLDHLWAVQDPSYPSQDQSLSTTPIDT